MDRGSATRRELLEIALKLIDERGADRLSVRAVARAAGLSSGAPFRHFADKKALLSAVALEGLQKLNRTIDATVAEHTDDPLAAFQAMGVAYVELAMQYPARFRAMHHPEYTGFSAPQEVRDAVGHLRRLLVAQVVAAQQRGQLQPLEPERIVLAAHALVYGLARLLIDGASGYESLEPDQIRGLAKEATQLFGVGVLGR
jgi:AcrR family transcriptional regulator